MDPSAIAYCKVFPGIGIARVGNSPDAFFIGPELPGAVPDNGGSYKDAVGRVKRQAARFRAYAFDIHDQIIGELTAETDRIAEIAWTVTLANTKAAWHQFAGTAAVARILTGGSKPPLRNTAVTGADRNLLALRPAPVTVAGPNHPPASLEGDFAVRIGGESFPARPVRVSLGELRTDESGRLLVLGGRGASDSVLPDNPLSHYANNDGWYDDTSDGPVVARVTLDDGSTVPVRGRSWVIVAPPHYSPHTENIVTLYDVLTETAVEQALPWPEGEFGPRPNAAAPVSFARDIYPILRRLVAYQWVSDRARRGHSAGKPGNFLAEEQLAVLADPTKAGPGSPHARIVDRVRVPILHPPILGARKPLAWEFDPNSQDAIDQANLSYMPPLAGDEGDVAHGDPTTWLSVTASQYHKLLRWKDKDFVNDWPAQAGAKQFEDLKPEDQPAALTRATLEACQGGAFFPGIEMTSIARFKDHFAEAYRLSDTLSPGDVTRWMALPWQADFYECRDHWWPAVRPDAVVPDEEYERVVEKFPGEATGGRVASLLIARQPWGRGLGISVPLRPGLPDPASPAFAGAAPATYQIACQGHLDRFIRGFLGVFPTPLERESTDLYERRLQEFLFRTVATPGSGLLLKPPTPGESAGDYATRIRADTAAFLRERTRLDPPDASETLRAYADRVARQSAEAPWQGLFDVEWRRRARHQGKNDLARDWSRLGFVTPRQTPHGETVYVESDRGRYELLAFRDYFYYLMNLEHHPDFLPRARELADEYLRLAWEQEPGFRATPSLEQYGFFPYDPVTFQARLEKIYEIERARAVRYNPALPDEESGEPLFRTLPQVVERIRQLAPFNQLDGSWLERATKAGPIAEVQAALFEIWSDEVGNGDPVQNHANVYTDLLHSAGIYLPPLRSRAYADNPDIWDASFSSPAYQSAIAYFPEQYFPELLGMTLYLEWEAIFLPAMVKLYEYHGYNPLFYRLHVAIDNTVNGHGAKAREAVVRYLDHVREESGERELQEHWRRIWNGYLAFRFVGGEEWGYRFANPPTPEERMLAMVEQKRHYAQLNHGVRRLGPNLINDWFDEPGDFLNELVESDLITKGDAKRSRIFDLLGFNGPMFKVFSARDKEVLADWINSLPPDPVGGTLDTGAAMLALVRKLRPRAAGVPEHAGPRLSGKFIDPATPGVEVEISKSVAWWFQIDQPERLLAALADPKNGWIVPKAPDASRFVREFLSTPRRMSRFLSQTIPEVGNKSARQVIIEWIAAGCPIPAIQPARSALLVPAAANARPAAGGPAAGADEYAREVQATTRFAPVPSPVLRAALRRHYGPGGGAPH